MSKTILITGASSGFGLACAEKFAQSCQRLILLARNQEKLDTIAKRLGKQCDALAVSVDVSDQNSLNRFFKEHEDALSTVDVLVNNAGKALGLESADKASLEQWQDMIATNITGLITMTRHILPYMVARNTGHIINIGSIAGSWPYPGGNVYGATKSFVHQFSLGLRADLLGKNIRVSNIEPGMAQTNFSNVRFEGNDDKANELYAGTQPLTGEDLAEVIHWVTALPAHVNVNVIELMPLCQAWGPLSVDRTMTE